VTVFREHADYLAYMTEILDDAALARQTAGGYVPATEEIVVTSHPTHGGAFSALYHEGFHQYFQSIVRAPPIWLNEGLADYFGASRLVEGRLVPGDRHPARERDLRRMMDRRPLGEPTRLFRMEHAEFMALGSGSRWARGENYALAWATVHFLLECGEAGWRDRFDAYLGEVLAGRPGGRAAETAFGDLEDGELADRVDRHVRLMYADLPPGKD
jgi:hypothetical protein